MSGRTALVVGARGVIGGNLIEHLESVGGWDVVGLSRRGGQDRGVVRHVAVDLLDREQTSRSLAGLDDVTHVFYAAYQDRPRGPSSSRPTWRCSPTSSTRSSPSRRGWSTSASCRGTRSTALTSDRSRPRPRGRSSAHAAGVQRRPAAVPRGAAGRGVLVLVGPPPLGRGGVGLGNPMNLAMVIAVYASISRELGVPFRFPGKPGAYTSLIEMTDADLLAKAAVFAATSPNGRNRAFNITNGDMFRWSSMWPKIAAFFDLEVAPPLPMSLTEVMADKAELWDRMISRHDLVPTSYSDVSSWEFGDFVFGWDYDVIADTSRSRRAGFHEYVETEEMFLRIFQDLRDQRLIP
ncbi:NAD-dependent epimerase/dehydratase family protein [Oerskovia sp. M15]